MTDIERLKTDLDNLAKKLKESEKDIYSRIDDTNKSMVNVTMDVKVIVEKLTTFISTFKNHDENEMKKYDNILDMFQKTQDKVQKLEINIGNKYATKEDMFEIEKKLEENNEVVKKGFKIFYIGTGVFVSLGVIGGLIMWILDLLSKLQQIWVH